MRAGVVVNVFEAVDVITLIKGGIGAAGGTYDDLTLGVGEALQKRDPVSSDICPD